MPRPRGLSSRPKKKVVVQVAEESGQTTSSPSTTTTGEKDEVTNETLAENAAHSPMSPRTLKRAVAVQLHDEAIRKAAIMRSIKKEELAKEALAKRIFEAKERRMDDAKKPKRKVGVESKINKVYRRYENIIALAEAQIQAAFVYRKVAEAEAEEHERHVGVLVLEIERLKRELRRAGAGTKI